MVEIPEVARTQGPFSPLFHEASELVGRRWTGAILYALSHGVDRFSDLEAAIPKMSARLLTERLRELEHVGIVRRVAPPTGARRTYQLTEKGEALRPVLMALNDWAVTWGPRSVRPDGGVEPDDCPVQGPGAEAGAG